MLCYSIFTGSVIFKAMPAKRLQGFSRKSRNFTFFEFSPEKGGASAKAVRSGVYRLSKIFRSNF